VVFVELLDWFVLGQVYDIADEYLGIFYSIHAL
jgi:hypothetical protein